MNQKNTEASQPAIKSQDDEEVDEVPSVLKKKTSLNIKSCYAFQAISHLQGHIAAPRPNNVATGMWALKHIV